MTSRPLDGITVVSLEQAVAAPYATRQLADLGARIIKVERPGSGDFARSYDATVHGQASYFVWLNRSKESLTLDIKHPSGRIVLDRLLESADVFVQNLAPGATRRMGLDAETLQQTHPRLIVCDISGYGLDGDWASRKAYDLLIQCEAGLVSLTGTPDGPSRVGVSIADIAAGMYAYSGILTSLYRRATSGETSSVDVSLFEALGEWMGAPAYYTQYGGTTPERVGAEHATIAPYGPYMLSDGTSIVLAAQNDREWHAFCVQIIGDASLANDVRFATNARRVEHRSDLNDLISERLSLLDSASAAAALDAAAIANGKVNDVRGFIEHPVLRSRHRWRTVATPGGDIEALLPPAQLSGVVPRMDPVPAVGEHAGDILRALGYTDVEVDELRTAAVI